MDTADTESRRIPAASETTPILEYARPKPSISIWQLIEVFGRYTFASVLVLYGTVLLQLVMLGLLGSMFRRAEGESLVIPLWLSVTLCVGTPATVLAVLIYRIAGNLIGRLLLWGWTAFVGVMLAYSAVGFDRAWGGK